MKRILLILVASLTLSGSLFAQNPPERVLFDPDYRDRSYSQYEQGPYVWEPFSDYMGYSIYGSRYRRAKVSRSWGIFLSTVVAPLGALTLLSGIDAELPGPIIFGAVGFLGGLGGGIPLWVKGRRELDWMMDDYARRYAPRPYGAALSVGPTRNGMGLALNF